MGDGGLHAEMAPLIKFQDASQTLPLLHELEALVNLIERQYVRHVLVQQGAALHVLLYEVGNL